MTSMFRMEMALKEFEKKGKISKITDNKSFRITINRQPERQNDGGQYLIEVHKMVEKGKKAPEEPELILRFDTLPRALSVANQALQGGLETMLLFHKPHMHF